ncbi:MAG: 2-methylfumaryl-CoA isomerase, partial [Rhodospirillaceae bacterium]|nr:2-methylfumaryl-CoA isomerase [Rhodospirillaceae bacterium]
MSEIVKGLRVVEVSAFIAAPYAGLSLAQMGADVIRIDPVGGGLDYGRWPVTKDGVSLYWAGLNKGKRSIMLNVRTDEGRELAHGLMTASDPDSGQSNGHPNGGIVITNLPARGWLDYEKLKAKRDDLIMLAITGNRDGSVALDYTVNAAAGFPSVTGPADYAGPVNHVMPVWDLIAGMSAA